MRPAVDCPGLKRKAFKIFSCLYSIKSRNPKIRTVRVFELLTLRIFNGALWPKPRSILCAQVVLIEHDRFLLVRTAVRKGWELPGGVVAPPEAPEVTVMRELGRQTGYELLDSPDLLGVFPDPARALLRSYFTVFVSRTFRSVEPASVSSRAEFRWFARDALPCDASPICGKVAGALID